MPDKVNVLNAKQPQDKTELRMVFGFMNVFSHIHVCHICMNGKETIFTVHTQMIE